MKCPYINPTIAQCENCPLDDCYRDERQDVNELKAAWIRNNPEKRRAIRRRHYLKNRETEIAHYKEYRARNIEEIRRKDRERKAQKRERQVG